MLGKLEILALFSAFVIYKYRNAPKPLGPIVRTEQGDLQGIQSISRDGRVYYEYLGIPYGKPPVGDLRFEAPQTPEEWNGVRKAIEYGNQCSQMPIIFDVQVGDENCLFLNVFSPKLDESTNILLPTMVFIHGGHFLEGSGNMYRPDYFMDENIILVTFNYRLAALGFLNTGDGTVRGNAGLKDQSMALKWVQRNIACFGGDPKQVTIFGESAGGASVHLQMISPLSQGLFQKSISQSGNAVEPWSIGRDPAGQAKRLAKLVNCPTLNTKLMVECLKVLPVAKLLETHVEARDPLRDYNSVYLPSIETLSDEASFLTEEPLTILQRTKTGIPWMTGVNSDEGLISLASLSKNRSLQIHLTNPENWLKSMPYLLFIQNIKESHLKEIRKFYFGTEEIIDFQKSAPNYTNLFSDVYSNYGFMESVKLHAQHSPVYAYQFSRAGQFSLFNFLTAVKGDYPAVLEIIIYRVMKWIRQNVVETSPPYLHGCSHADELAFLFKLEGMHEISLEDPDYAMSKKLVKLWVDFATDENSLKYKDMNWKPFNPKAQKFEVFNIDEEPEVTHPSFVDRVNFLKKKIFMYI